MSGKGFVRVVKGFGFHCKTLCTRAKHIPQIIPIETFRHKDRSWQIIVIESIFFNVGSEIMIVQYLPTEVDRQRIGSNCAPCLGFVYVG